MNTLLDETGEGHWTRASQRAVGDEPGASALFVEERGIWGSPLP